MIQLYTADAPNGRKASIALEELGLEYEVVRIRMDKREQHEPAFLALNPNNKIPVIRDGEQVVWESGAVLLYLAEKYDGEGRILPREPSLRIAAIQYAFFQTGGIGPNLGRLGQALREGNQERMELFTAECERLLGVIDRVLADGREFLAGPYSVGDIMHYPWLKIAQDIGFESITRRERVCGWLGRIGERPAVQRGMAVPKE